MMGRPPPPPPPRGPMGGTPLPGMGLPGKGLPLPGKGGLPGMGPGGILAGSRPPPPPPSGPTAPAVSTHGWTEHQTSDGKKFYHNAKDKVSQWETPAALKAPEELAVKDWEAYKLWNGREFFYNKVAKVSCYAVPPAVRRARGLQSEVKAPPVEKHHAFMALLEEVKVSETSHWNEVIKKIQDDPRYLAVESLARKRQLFAQKVSSAWKDKELVKRKRKREKLEEAADFLDGGLKPTWELFKDAARTQAWWSDVDENDLKVLYDSAVRPRDSKEGFVGECEAEIQEHFKTLDGRLQWGKVLDGLEADPKLHRHLERVGKSTALRLWIEHLDEVIAKADEEPLPPYPQRRQERKAREAFAKFVEETGANANTWGLMRPQLPTSVLQQVEGCKFVPEPADLLQEVLEEREKKRLKMD